MTKLEAKLHEALYSHLEALNKYGKADSRTFQALQALEAAETAVKRERARA